MLPTHRTVKSVFDLVQMELKLELNVFCRTDQNTLSFIRIRVNYLNLVLIFSALDDRYCSLRTVISIMLSENTDCFSVLQATAGLRNMSQK